VDLVLRDFSSFVFKTIANVLRDRVQLESLRKRMPVDHPSYNRITSLLEVKNSRKEF
jgi:hypothetical protein